MLNDRETVVCWCGTDVEKREIETTLDRLKAAGSEKFEERSALKDNLEGLKAEKRRTEEERRERERIEDRLAEIKAELEDRAAVLEEREKLNGQSSASNLLDNCALQ